MLRTLCVGTVLFAAVLSMSLLTARAAEPQITVPVMYGTQIVVLVSVKGVAAVDFGETLAAGALADEIPKGVHYRFRFWTPGGAEQHGKGKVFERDKTAVIKGREVKLIDGELKVKAGPMEITWSKGARTTVGFTTSPRRWPCS